MSKTMAYFWDEAENFLNAQIKRIESQEISLDTAVENCLQSNQSWDLVGYDDTIHYLQDWLKEYFHVNTRPNN